MPEDRIEDPGLYRRLSEPFPSFNAANDAINAFNVDLRAIREKHKIPDIVFVIAVSAIGDDGDVGDFVLGGGHGDGLKDESLFAYGFAKAQSERQ